MKLNNYLKKIDFIYWSLLFFAVFPLIPNKIKGLTVILLFLFSVFNLKSIKRIHWKDFFVNSSLYLVFLISFLLFNIESDESVQILETTLSILVIPIIFSILLPSYNFDEKLKLNFIKTFITSTTIFAVILTFYIFFDTTTYYYSDWYTNKARTLIEKFPYIGQHPIYASIYCAISTFFWIHITNVKKSNIFTLKNIYFFICFVINVFFLFLLSSRGVIISILITFLFFTFSKIRRISHKIYLVLIFSVLMVSLFNYNRRMKELINFETYLKVDSNFSNSYRFQTYKCSFKLLQENIFFGYGVGNVQLKLNDCYRKNNLDLMVKKYNTHNQYLDLILKVGIIGLIIFLVFFVSNFLKAIYLKNNIVILIIIFYSIVFLTENLLLRQSGVILFYFLILFFNKFTFSLEKHND